MRSAILVGCVVAAVATGCHGSHPAAKGTEPHIVVKLSTVPLPRRLPRRACLVGVLDYDVTIFGLAQHSTDICTRLADRYLGPCRQLPWDRRRALGADSVSECDLSKNGVRVSVSRNDPDFEGPRFERAYELSDRVCASLRSHGWRTRRDG